MLDKIDYYSHKTYQNPYYHRQYENDLPQVTKDGSYTEQAKRISLIALPFLSLYQPLGKVISISMGSLRVVTNGIAVFNSDLYQIAYQVIQVSLASIALIGTIYNFTLGLYITTVADIIANSTKILEAFYHQEYKEASAELLQVISSSLFLAILMTGSLEVALASLLIQALISFYQAKEEWTNGRIPEALAKSTMGMVRLFQANQQIQVIQKRDALLQRYREIAERIYKGRKIDHLWDHPFIQPAAGQLGTLIEDGNGNSYNFGSNFHGHGGQIVKGMNINFKDHGDYTSLDFKVNHVFRDRLEKSIEEFSSYSQEDLRDLLQILGSHATNITISKHPASLDEYNSLGEMYEIKIEGLGKIEVGASKHPMTFYDKINIQLEKGKNLYDLHETLSFLKLEDVLRQSANEDIERLKIGQLFRIFNPKEATAFERTDSFFDLPLEELRQKIFSLSPEMISIFEKYLPRMELREIVPGRMRYAINGLADELHQNGALGLTTALTGAWEQKDINERIASILKMGMISSEMRRDHEINKSGLSSGTDFYTGGADSVFTQIVTDKNRSYKEYAYQADVRLLISPKVLETGTYQYHSDSFGNRIISSDWWFLDLEYAKRENIFDFLAAEKADFNIDNEVMIKERIAPEFITGIVVNSDQMKEQLLNHLRQSQIVQKDSLGNETILSKNVDQFIHVGKKIESNHFS